MQFDFTQGPFYIPPDKNPIHRRAERKNFSRLFFGLFVYLMVGGLVEGTLMILLPRFFPAKEYAELIQLATRIIPHYLLAVPLFWLMVSGCPKKSPEKKPTTFSSRAGLLAIAFCALYLGNFISIILSNLITNVTGQESQSIVNSMAQDYSPLFYLIVVVICAPIFEELVFRKILLERLLPYSEHLAILLSAFLFGMIHGNIQQFFYAFTTGIVFGYIYVKLGGLRHSILLHMAINFTGSFIPMLFTKNSDRLTIASSIDLMEILHALYIRGELVLAFLGLILIALNLKRFTASKAGERALTIKSQYQLAFGNFGMVCFLVVCALTFIMSFFIYY